jgi:hypothetical protein
LKDIHNINRKFVVDFYLPKQNIIIEYNGEQHYRPVKWSSKTTDEDADKNFADQQARDEFVQNFCIANNIKLIWIDGRYYVNSSLENFITKEIIPLIKNGE